MISSLIGHSGILHIYNSSSVKKKDQRHLLLQLLTMVAVDAIVVVATVTLLHVVATLIIDFVVLVLICCCFYCILWCCHSSVFNCEDILVLLLFSFHRQWLRVTLSMLSEELLVIVMLSTRMWRTCTAEP